MRLAHVGGHAVDVRDEAQVLTAAQAQQVVGGVSDKAQAALGLHGVFGHVDAIDLDGAPRGCEHAHEHVERRGLARTVGAQDAKDLSIAHLKGEVTHREGLAPVVGLRDVIDLNHDSSQPR